MGLSHAIVVRRSKSVFGTHGREHEECYIMDCLEDDLRLLTKTKTYIGCGPQRVRGHTKELLS